MVKLIGKCIVILSSSGMWLLSLAAVCLLFLIFKEEGLAGVWSTITVDVAGTLSKFMLMLIVFFTITGSINHLQKQHPEGFREVVSGKYGTVPMVLLSMVMPGPAGGKQLQDAWNTPGADKAVLILCLTAMMGGSITMFMFRSKFIGPTLTLVWVGIVSCVLFQVWFIGKIRPWIWFV